MAKDLTAALHALTEEANGQSSREEKKLPPAKEQSAIPPRTGTSKNEGKSSSSGIASPLIETAYADRTFHANKTILSTDGLFGIVIKPIKTVTFEDAARNTVVIEYKEPT